jgi:hypothetical protein
MNPLIQLSTGPFTPKGISDSFPFPGGLCGSNPLLVRKTFLQTILAVAISVLAPILAHAGSATWELNPGAGDWNTAANWTPITVPNGPADVATFALSNTTNVSISANTEVNGITFTAAATNPYTISASFDITLTISGTGITNNSGIAQHFMTNGGQFGQISFTNNATAGSSTIFTNNHGVNDFQGGHTFFFDTSTAGSGTFINKNGAVGGLFQGFTEFFDSTTAGKATIINNGSTMANFGNGGGTGFLDSSSAGNATIINDGGMANNAGGGSTFFADSSTAASATVTNNAGMVSGASGGLTQFIGTATAANGVFVNNGGTVSGARGGQTVFHDNSTAGNSTLIANSGMIGGLGGTIFLYRIPLVAPHGWRRSATVVWR